MAEDPKPVPQCRRSVHPGEGYSICLAGSQRICVPGRDFPGKVLNHPHATLSLSQAHYKYPKTVTILPKRWDLECTAKTDSDGRLVQRESYVAGNGGYTFDPREVFQGEGGGAGGRGGGRGDGTTLPDTTVDEGGANEVMRFAVGLSRVHTTLREETSEYVQPPQEGRLEEAEQS